MDASAYMDDFRAEATEHLGTLDAKLLQLERDSADARPIRAMFLSAHTIKGGAAMLGLAPVRELAHALEDVLSCLRDRNTPLDAETADLLFRTLDRLRELVAADPSADPPDAATAGLIAALQARAQAPDAPGAAVPASAPPAVAAARPRAARRRVPHDSHAVDHAAEGGGFEVDAIEDGQQALMLARTGAYQLVVTSVEIPGIRGLALAAALRASPACAHLPIIIMSSDDNPADKQQAAEIGVQAYLRKGSFGQQQLVEAAQEALRPALASPRGTVLPSWYEQ